MESTIGQSVHERIFHVDRECYIVYLGIDGEEICPFVRIGNTNELKDIVHQLVSTVLVTDRHTGNPLLEIDLSRKTEGGYLGDPRVVSSIKNFFESFNLSSDSVSDYSSKRDAGKKDMVYFYNNGNIQLNFCNELLFDLYNREKRDVHYLKRCEEIISAYRKDPVRYQKKDLKGKGFFHSEGSFYIFKDGNTFGLTVTPDYFEAMVRHGIDPDSLCGILSTIDENKLSTEDGKSFVSFVKRSRFIRKPVKIMSDNSSFIKKSAELFTDLKSKKKKLLVKPVDNNHEVFNMLKVVSSKQFSTHDGSDIIWNGAGSFTIKNKEIETNVYIPEGVPCELVSQDPDLSDLRNIFFKEFFKDASFVGLSGEQKLFVKESCDLAIDWIDAVLHKKEKPTGLIKDKATTWYNKLKKIKAQDGTLPWLVQINLNSMAKVLLNHDPGKEYKKIFEDLFKSTKSFLKKSGWKTEELITATVFSSGLLFFVPSRDKHSEKEYRSSAEFRSQTLSSIRYPEKFYSSEKDRLYELIALLERGEKPDFVLNRKREEEDVVTVVPASENEQTVIAEEKEEDKKKKVTSGKDNENESKGKKRGGLILIIILLLLLGSLAFLLFRGGENSLFNRIKRDGFAVVFEDPFGRDIDNDYNESDNNSDEENNNQDSNSESNENSSDSSENSDDNENGVDADDYTSGTEEGSEGEEIELAEPTQIDNDLFMDDIASENIAISGIAITLADVHLAANDIAIKNGYRDLSFGEVDGDDPGRIEPGEVLTLANGQVYTIKADDTIWFIAARYIEKALVVGVQELDKVKESGEGKEKLKELQAYMWSENYRILVDQL